MHFFATWRSVRPFVLAPAAAAALALAACSASLDKNPTILKQAKRIQDMDDSVKALDRRLATVSADLQDSSRDIASIKSAQGAVNADAVAALEQRVTNLEASLQTANKTVAAMASSMKSVQEASARPSRSAYSDGTATASASETRAGTTKRVHARGVAAASRSESRETARAGKTRGSYYLVKSGETLESIAASNKTSAKMVSEANRLPAGAHVLPGQRLYVPGH